MTLKEYMEKLGTNDIEAALGILAKEIASMKFPTAGSHKVAVKIVKSLNKKEKNIYLEKLSEALLDNQETIKIHTQFYQSASHSPENPHRSHGSCSYSKAVQRYRLRHNY